MTYAHVLTPDELRRLDAAYRPIEPFDAWADLAPSADVWDRYVERYEAARSAADPDALAAALRDVARGASFDTGAIEGLYAGDRGITHTVMTQAATWEAYVAQERGPDVVEFVKAHVEGFEMALDLATGSRPVTESWARQVHEVVCAPQATCEVTTSLGRQQHVLPKGAYKAEPNHVLQPDGTPFAYAPVDRVGEEMARLVEQARRPEFEAAHPATQAAYIHHAFVRVHPFADGNGRVARVLSSVPLLRALSIPLVVYADQRPQYLVALRRADRDERAGLVDFIGDRAVDVMGLLADLQSRPRIDPLADLTQVWATANRRSDDELSPVAERVIEIIATEWAERARTVGLPDGISATVEVNELLSDFHEEERVLLGTEFRFLRSGRHEAETTITTDGSPPAHSRRWLVIGAARSSVTPFAFRVAARGWRRDLATRPLDVRWEDAHPGPTTAFRLRARAWAMAVFDDQLGDLVADLG